MTEHPPHDFLCKLADGELTINEEAQRVLAHLNDECPACRAEFERLVNERPSEKKVDEIGLADLVAVAGVSEVNRGVTAWLPQERYRGLKLHKQGGLGAIYLAYDTVLERFVALKRILPELSQSPQLRTRFEREAKLTGRLGHPNIVAVHSLGRDTDGHPFYVMPFIDNESLRDAIVRFHATFKAGARRGGAAMARAREDLLGRFVKVCEAIAFAHSRGVVHRDLKPDNVMLGPYGETLVIDWGLAKCVDSPSSQVPEGVPMTRSWDDGDPGETVSGHAIGTLPYMSPEQAAGDTDRIGPASDIYGLGSILFHLLAGRPPLEGEREAIAARIREGGTLPGPRSLRPDVPRSLERICLKAMAREPGDRYATVTAFKEDVESWLRDRPVVAWEGREPLVLLAGRCLRRNWIGVSAALLVLVVGLGAGLAVAIPYGKALDRKNNDLSQALKNERIARSAETTALVAQTKARHAEADAKQDAQANLYQSLVFDNRNRRLAREPGWRDQAKEVLRHALTLRSDQQDIAELRTEAVSTLGEFDVREVARLVGHRDVLWSLAFSPDGATLASSGESGGLRQWDLRRRVCLGRIDDPLIRAVDLYDASVPFPAVQFLAGGRPQLAYSRWPSAIGFVKSAEGQEPAADRWTTPSPVRCLASDRAGTRLVASLGDGEHGWVQVFDAATGRLLRQFEARAGVHMPVALSPDGRWLAFTDGQSDPEQWATQGLLVRLVDLSTDHEPFTLRGHTKTVRGLRFNPDGTLLASVSHDNTVKLWSIAAREERFTLGGHESKVNAVAFSPDGELVATCSDDGTARLWQVRNGDRLVVLKPQVGMLTALAFSPDGETLATGMQTVVVFRIVGRTVRRSLYGHDDHVHNVTFHPLQGYLASGGADHNVFFWDVTDGRRLRRWFGHPRKMASVLAFSPDGRFLAVGPTSYRNIPETDQTVKVWETQTGSLFRSLEGHQADIASLGFSRDGSRLAAGGLDGRVVVWDVEAGKVAEAILENDSGPALGVAYRDEGRQLVIGHQSGLLKVWDQQPRVLLERHQAGEMTCFADAVDGRLLATGDDMGRIRLWEAAALTEAGMIEQAHDGGVRTAAFSPDSTLLASGGGDRRVVLWDVRSRRKLFAFPVEDQQILSIAFSPDGSHLAYCADNERIVVWDLIQVRSGLAELGLDWTAHGSSAANRAAAGEPPNSDSPVIVRPQEDDPAEIIDRIRYAGDARSSD
jgi:WD40 repeat protein